MLLEWGGNLADVDSDWIVETTPEIYADDGGEAHGDSYAPPRSFRI